MLIRKVLGNPLTWWTEALGDSVNCFIRPFSPSLVNGFVNQLSLSWLNVVIYTASSGQGGKCPYCGILQRRGRVEEKRFLLPPSHLPAEIWFISQVLIVPSWQQIWPPKSGWWGRRIWVRKAFGENFSWNSQHRTNVPLRVATPAQFWLFTSKAVSLNIVPSIPHAWPELFPVRPAASGEAVGNFFDSQVSSAPSRILKRAWERQAFRLLWCKTVPRLGAEETRQDRVKGLICASDILKSDCLD